MLNHFLYKNAWDSECYLLVWQVSIGHHTVFTSGVSDAVEVIESVRCVCVCACVCLSVIQQSPG